MRAKARQRGGASPQMPASMNAVQERHEVLPGVQATLNARSVTEEAMNSQPASSVRRCSV
jgi:hypothetical protein